jgi:hypothetical protein
MAEIYIRIIKTRLFRYFHFNNTTNWVNVVDKIVYSLNHSHHSTLGVAPVDVTEKNSSEIWYRIYKNYIEQKQDKPKFKVGDLVRMSSEKHIFKKGYVGNFTTEIFKVSKIRPTKPVTYDIVDLNGEEIKGSFYAFEITKVTSSLPKDTR